MASPTFDELAAMPGAKLVADADPVKGLSFDELAKHPGAKVVSEEPASPAPEKVGPFEALASKWGNAATSGAGDRLGAQLQEDLGNVKALSEGRFRDLTPGTLTRAVLAGMGPLGPAVAGLPLGFLKSAKRGDPRALAENRSINARAGADQPEMSAIGNVGGAVLNPESLALASLMAPLTGATKAIQTGAPFLEKALRLGATAAPIGAYQGAQNASEAGATPVQAGAAGLEGAAKGFAMGAAPLAYGGYSIGSGLGKGADTEAGLTDILGGGLQVAGGMASSLPLDKAALAARNMASRARGHIQSDIAMEDVARAAEQAKLERLFTRQANTLASGQLGELAAGEGRLPTGEPALSPDAQAAGKLGGLMKEGQAFLRSKDPLGLKLSPLAERGVQNIIPPYEAKANAHLERFAPGVDAVLEQIKAELAAEQAKTAGSRGAPAFNPSEVPGVSAKVRALSQGVRSPASIFPPREDVGSQPFGGTASKATDFLTPLGKIGESADRGRSIAWKDQTNAEAPNVFSELTKEMGLEKPRTLGNTPSPLYRPNEYPSSMTPRIDKRVAMGPKEAPPRGGQFITPSALGIMSRIANKLLPGLEAKSRIGDTAYGASQALQNAEAAVPVREADDKQAFLQWLLERAANRGQ